MGVCERVCVFAETNNQYHTCAEAITDHVPTCEWDSSVDIQPDSEETCRYTINQ